MRCVLAEAVVCPLCGRDNTTLITTPVEFQGLSAQYSICDMCGIAYQNPKLTDNVLGVYADWAWGSPNVVKYATKDRCSLRAKADWDRFKRLDVSLSESLLDYGAGAGGFVATANKNGIRAVGYEPSISARQAAKEYYGITLLDTPPALGSRFDCVWAHSVFEHVFSGLKLIPSLVSWAKRWVVITTPKWNRGRANRWGHYAPGHLCLYSPEAITKLFASQHFILNGSWDERDDNITYLFQRGGE